MARAGRAGAVAPEARLSPQRAREVRYVAANISLQSFGGLQFDASAQRNKRLGNPPLRAGPL